MKNHLFPIVLLLFSLSTSLTFSAEEAAAHPLASGRYVLITKDNAEQAPLIVNVIKKDDGLFMSVENQEYADTAVRNEGGTIIFQLSRRAKDPGWRMPGEYLLTFACTRSDYIAGSVGGPFSRFTISTNAEFAPSLDTGTFLLFPIDKEK